MASFCATCFLVAFANGQAHWSMSLLGAGELLSEPQLNQKRGIAAVWLQNLTVLDLT